MGHPTHCCLGPIDTCNMCQMIDVIDIHYQLMRPWQSPLISNHAYNMFEYFSIMWDKFFNETWYMLVVLWHNMWSLWYSNRLHWRYLPYVGANKPQECHIRSLSNWIHEWRNDSCDLWASLYTCIMRKDPWIAWN